MTKKKTMEEVAADWADLKFKGIAIMMLWAATANGITLKEACERFLVENMKKDPNPFSPELNLVLKKRMVRIEIDEDEFRGYQQEVADMLKDMIGAKII